MLRIFYRSHGICGIRILRTEALRQLYQKRQQPEKREMELLCGV